MSSKKIQELTGDESSGPSSRTFVISDEGHTLGNVLKNLIGSYNDVAFCGYTIPHPQENKMHFRIQTVNADIRAIDMLKRGLKDLENICDHTIETFEIEMNKTKTEQV